MYVTSEKKCESEVREYLLYWKQSSGEEFGLWNVLVVMCDCRPVTRREIFAVTEY
jgi:hypothetical protein